jgi:hypothetical protein
MKPTLFMETTRIAPARTVAEIQENLAVHGASQVLMEYEAMNVSAVSFKYKVGPQDIPFRLPCRWRNIETLLRQSGKRPRYDDTYESWARRVAWRQILRWVEAQMALVETSMVQVQEVFFPYIQMPTGRTLYELQAERGFALEWKPSPSGSAGKGTGKEE